MPEKKTRIKKYTVEYTCDKCKKGNMRSLGVKFLTEKNPYPHKCDNCDYTKSLTKCYPHEVEEHVSED